MTASYTPLSPVSVAVYTALNVSAVTTLAVGGIHDDVPQNTRFPFVLFEVQETQQMGGFGTKPGVHALPEVGLRLHIYTQDEGFKTAQAILAQCLKVLADPPTVTGYGSWAIFHDESIPLSDQLVAGVKVKELVANLRLYVEES